MAMVKYGTKNIKDKLSSKINTKIVVDEDKKIVKESKINSKKVDK